MSFNGGYINSVCLASLLKSPVGYVTGNLTLVGESIENGQPVLLFHLIVLVFCFLIGSVISGLVIEGQNYKIDRRYSFSLILQCIAVIAATLLLLFNCYQASYLLAATMGMQNAMISHYGSALIRTTHMTGTTTDLGVLISQWLKGHAIPTWKIKLYLNLIVGFASGAIAGALAYPALHAYSLGVCVLIYVIMMSWRWYKN